jgi:hypothetical protein
MDQTLLQAGLTLATASTDTIPPASAITSAANGASIAAGAIVTMRAACPIA